MKLRYIALHQLNLKYIKMLPLAGGKHVIKHEEVTSQELAANEKNTRGRNKNTFNAHARPLCNKGDYEDKKGTKENGERKN